MQNRNVIKIFAVIFALVCLYQLSFTWISDGVEEDAVSYAANFEENEREAKERASVAIEHCRRHRCRHPASSLSFSVFGGGLFSVSFRLRFFSIFSSLFSFRSCGWYTPSV